MPGSDKTFPALHLNNQTCSVIINEECCCIWDAPRHPNAKSSMSEFFVSSCLVQHPLQGVRRHRPIGWQSALTLICNTAMWRSEAAVRWSSDGERRFIERWQQNPRGDDVTESENLKMLARISGGSSATRLLAMLAPLAMIDYFLSPRMTHERSGS